MKGIIKTLIYDATGIRDEKRSRMLKKKSRLKEIKISGYKSLGTDIQPINLEMSNLNIIIGANGAGKSNFISFFQMLANMMTGALQIYVGKNGSSESLLQFGSKRTKMISASLVFQNDRFTDTYEFSLVKAVNDTLIFAEEVINDGKNKFELSSGQKESFLLTDEAAHASERAVRAILSGCKTFQFHDTSSEAHIRSAAYIENNRFLMSDGGNVASYLYMLKMKYEQYYKRIVDHVRYVMPTFHDFFLEPQILNPQWIKLQWFEKGNSEYVFGPEHFSDGTLRFIALATLFLQPPELLPQVIFVDEPELGLHPQAVDVLASMVQRAKENTQIIMATQSPRLLDSFDYKDIIVAEKDRETGCTILKRLDEKEIKIWLEDYSLSQIWEKNIIGGQP